MLKLALLFLPISCSFLTYSRAVVNVKAEDWTYRLKEEVETPRGWINLGSPPQSHMIRLRIGLPQLNFSELENQLLQISDPSHHNYGKHLSKTDVERLVSPHKDAIYSVDEWLEICSISKSQISRSPANDWVIINISIDLAEEMLNTTYYVWQHVSINERLVRTTHYSVPDYVHKHIDVIQPTTMFSRFQAQKSMVVLPNPEAKIVEPNVQMEKLVNTMGASVDAACNRTVTISCLQQLYNAVNYTPSGTIGNSIGVAGYLDDYANRQDLQAFYADQRPDAVNSTFNFVSVKDGLDDQTPAAAGHESNLDVQFAFGLSFPVTSTFYSTAGRPEYIPDMNTPSNTNEPYMDWLDYVLSQSNPPVTISTSYGDDEQTVPKNYAERVCSGFAQLGARGVSLLFSSGDGGVGGGNNLSTQSCLTNDGVDRVAFIPTFPASCPYVTAVGATTGISPEVAVSRFYSGGGFSNYFSRPAYQKDAVASYLSTLPEGLYQGFYNSQGRAYPDVAAQGDNFKIIHQGKATLIGGTSAAAPAFAAFVALLNDVRLRNNLSSLGFLNPWIYSNGSVGFNDITTGNAAGCGTPGFGASAGWDPVTGYGTPNFGKLKDLVLTVSRTMITSAARPVSGDCQRYISSVISLGVMRILCDFIL